MEENIPYESTLPRLIKRRYAIIYNAAMRSPNHTVPTYTEDEFVNWVMKSEVFMDIYNTWDKYHSDTKPRILKKDFFGNYELNNLHITTYALDKKRSADSPTKRCNTCLEELDKSLFYKSTLFDGYMKWCIECSKKKARSLSGLITVIYTGQKRSSKKRGHPMPDYDLKWLKEWFMKDDKYINMHKIWEKSGYLNDLIPSVDRINDDLPYTKTNIQLLTWKENRDKACINNSRNIVRFINNKKFIYNGIVDASIHTGIHKSSIWRKLQKKTDLEWTYL